MERAELEQIIERARVDRSTNLDLRNNELYILSESIGNLANLVSLDLYKNELTTLPETIGNLSKLMRLFLNQNQLTSLPDSICTLSNLTSLVLSYNQLTNLPEDIGNLSSLTSLYLNQNQLTSLPDSIESLSNLTEIYLSDNPWIDLSNLQNIPHLKRVYCFGTNLSQRYWTHQSKWKAESLLNEDNAYIRHALIEQIGYEEILEELTLFIPEYLQKESISHTIEFELNLRDNQLATLPKSISKLNYLTKLDLESNLLTSLPKNIDNLSKLIELNLDSNRLISLPESIGNLSSLTTLYLRYNQLTNLPTNIGNLFNLIELNLDDNKLTRLPESIGNLSNLITLDIGNNRLTKLPESVANLSNLTTLHLRGNPWVDLSILQYIPNLENIYCFDVDLPRRYWTKLSEWKAKWLLDEDNAEIRRVLIDRVGYEKICEALNAVTLDTWQEYTLLKIDEIEPIYDDEDEPIYREPMVLLKMTCPSTSHIHILRVPPEMVSAAAAITWVNHGIHPDKFAVQT